VRIIAVSGKSEIVVNSDIEIGRIWENYRTSRGNFHSQNAAIFHRNGTACPVSGCTRCEVSDCFYAEFIHSYMGCAKGDWYLYRKAGWIGKISQNGYRRIRTRKLSKIQKSQQTVWLGIMGKMSQCPRYAADLKRIGIQRGASSYMVRFRRPAIA